MDDRLTFRDARSQRLCGARSEEWVSVRTVPWTLVMGGSDSGDGSWAAHGLFVLSLRAQSHNGVTDVPHN